MSRVFRLYIDESGDHTLSKKEPQISQKDNLNKRYLGLTCCIIETEEYRDSFSPTLDRLKQRHFSHYHSPDDPVILHREDIIQKRGPFSILKDTECKEAFNRDLLLFFKESKYIVISVVIDKKAQRERYQDLALHPYHQCLAAILERYCSFLHSLNAKGDVLAESRGGTEDMLLKKAYETIYDVGIPPKDPSFFQKALTSKEIKLKLKKFNIAGLQLSDLLAHPLKQEILIEQNILSELDPEHFGRKICKIIQEKYNKDPASKKVHNYGKILL